NPFGEGWDGNNRMGDIRLDVGAYSPTDTDLSLFCSGLRWNVGRTYNGVQRSGASHFNSNGPQGANWFQSSQPEIFFVDDGDDELDMIYLVYGADRYLEFKRIDDYSTVFKGKNGAAGVIEYSATSPETYIYHDQHNNRMYFFGFNT